MTACTIVGYLNLSKFQTHNHVRLYPPYAGTVMGSRRKSRAVKTSPNAAERSGRAPVLRFGPKNPR